MEQSKKRELTEQQQKFLDVLFDEEANGNIRKAMKLAGYSDTTPSSVVINSLSEEITEVAKKVLAANSVRAVISTLDVLDNAGALGASNKLKAAEIILNRAGVAKKEDSRDINLKVPSGGLFILPAKSKDEEAEALKNDQSSPTDQ